MILGKEIRKEVKNKENYFNEFLEDAGKVYLEYNFKMNNANRETDDRFRILLYPQKLSGKLVFYADSLYLYTYLESIAKQLKEYCVALEKVKETEKEYRKAWRDLTRMYGGPNLVKVDFSKTLDEAQNQIGNNILAILDEREISIREMSINMGLDYAGLHRLVNKDSLENVTLKKLLEVAEYLKVDVQDLYK